MARPSDYSQKIADSICNQLSEGRSMRAICSALDMPAASTVYRWLEAHPEFQEQYARAREVQAETLAAEALEIADTPVMGVVETEKFDKAGKPVTEVKRGDMIEHRRLQVDARKWLAGKLSPKVYGDRLAVEHSGTIGIEVRNAATEDLLAELAELLTTGRVKLPGQPIGQMPDLQVIEGEATLIEERPLAQLEADYGDLL